jgi:hypothetical protein
MMNLQENIQRIKEVMGLNESSMLLQELLDSEVMKLYSYGFEIVDRFDVEPYTMLLLYNKEDDAYEISLTTGDDEFTTFDSQVTKSPSHRSNFLKISKMMLSKVNEWLETHKQLTVGSLNKSRTYKYNRMFQRMGVNVGEVEYTPEDDNFPESYNFTISSKNNI